MRLVGESVSECFRKHRAGSEGLVRRCKLDVLNVSTHEDVPNDRGIDELNDKTLIDAYTSNMRQLLQELKKVARLDI